VTADFSLDRDGTDIQVRAGGSMRPSLDIQLKATINLGKPTNGEFRYPLKRRNYDLLREPTMIPRILVLLELPDKETCWLTVTPQKLILRRCAYWTSLTGFPETQNKDTVISRGAGAGRRRGWGGEVIVGALTQFHSRTRGPGISAGTAIA
jgi:hypothetical protein